MIFQDLYDYCIKNKISLSCAESCTAGLISSKITSVSGSSEIFKGGIIAYQNSIKINQLNVSQKIINEKTEVSNEVVEQMAYTVRRNFNSDFSLAISGYAGPTGGTEKNPIGTIFIAISSKSSTHSKRFQLIGNRDSIVNQSVIKAVAYLLSELKKR